MMPIFTRFIIHTRLFVVRGPARLTDCHAIPDIASYDYIALYLARLLWCASSNTGLGLAQSLVTTYLCIIQTL